MYRRIFSINSATKSFGLPNKGIHAANESSMPDFFSVRTEQIQKDTNHVTVDNNLIYISWRTTAESNMRHFELQRSVNGKDFSLIETIMASGFSKTISRYAATDSKRFFFDKIYYRLKLVFMNGKEIFTDTITLDLNTVAGASVYDLTYTRNQQ